MKRTLSILLLAGVFSVATVGCKKDKAEDCNGMAQDVSTKGTAYANDPSVANCNAYKTALTSYVNSSCSNMTQAQKDEYQAAISMLS